MKYLGGRTIFHLTPQSLLIILQNNLSPDIIMIFITILLILMIILALVIFFLLVLYRKFRKQQRSNYPFKSKTVITKERKILSISSTNVNLKNEDKNPQTGDIDSIVGIPEDMGLAEEKEKEEKVEDDKQKEESIDMAEEKVIAVKPIRITSGSSRSDIKLAKRVENDSEKK